MTSNTPTTRRFTQLENDRDSLYELAADLRARFDQVDARFDQVDARFDQVDVRFDRLEGSLAEVLRRLPESR